MKKTILLSAILLICAYGFGQRYTLAIQSGEIKKVYDDGTVNQIKGTSVGTYSWNTDNRITVTSSDFSTLIVIDRSLLRTYNGSATIPINDTIMAHIKSISTVTSSGGGTTGGSTQVGNDSTNLLLKTIKARQSPIPRIVRVNDSLVRGVQLADYSVNDVITDTTSGSYRNVTITNAARSNGGSGYIMFGDLATNNTAWAGAVIVAVIYDSIVPVINDHAQFTKLYAQKRHKVGEVQFTLTAGGTGSDAVGAVGQVIPTDRPLAFMTQANSRNLYVIYKITTVVSTPASGQKFYTTWQIDQY